MAVDNPNLDAVMIALQPPPGHVRQVDAIEPAPPRWYELVATGDGNGQAVAEGLMPRTGSGEHGLIPRRLSDVPTEQAFTEAVDQLSAWPLSTVGRLTAVFETGSRNCTATVIAERVVLTAAHCVYARPSQRATGDGERATGGAARWVRFEPQAMDGQSLGGWVGEAFYVHRGWIDPAGGESPSAYDYALIRLDRPIAAATGTVRVWTRSEMEGPFVALGYPYKATGDFMFDGRFLYATTGARLNGSSPGVVEAANALTEGSSGGPWFARSPSGMAVVGINSSKPVGDDRSTFSPMLGEGYMALEARVLGDMTGM